MTAHFFDIDCLLRLEQKAWIVDKSNLDKPLLKISAQEFNLFESGIYLKHGHEIKFGEKTFYLDPKTYQQLRVVLKKTRVSEDNLGISLIEFLDPDTIKSLKYAFNKDIIERFKNSQDDLYIILSKQTRTSHSHILEKLRNAFRDVGADLKRYYFISERFYSESRDDVKFAKLKILASHLTGYKIEANKFVDKEVEEYRTINYWDNSLETPKYLDYISDVIRFTLKNSSRPLQEVIKENIVQIPPVFITNWVVDNTINPVQKSERVIVLQKFVKTFESFK